MRLCFQLAEGLLEEALIGPFGWEGWDKYRIGCVRNPTSFRPLTKCTFEGR